MEENETHTCVWCQSSMDPDLAVCNGCWEEMKWEADKRRNLALVLALNACASAAGHPDPAEGCRLVIATVKDALRLP